MSGSVNKLDISILVWFLYHGDSNQFLVIKLCGFLQNIEHLSYHLS